MERSGVTPDVAVAAPDLAELAAAEGPFATIYLTTDPAIDNAAHRSEQRWKSLRGELASAGAPEDVLAAVDPLVTDAHLEGGCLFVVANSRGLLQVGHLSAPPERDVGQWAPVPFLVPLLAWRQSWPAHVVVLTDRRGADLMAHGWGIPDVEREAGGGEDPLAKSAPGGWSQRRYQQRAENTWEHNADDVANEVSRLVEQVDARVVVAAGDVRALQLLEEALPKEVAEKLEKVSGGRSEDGSEETIHERAHQLLASVVARDTETLLAKLAEELGQGDRAVEGPAPTVDALARAQVEVLVVRHEPDDERQAWFGPGPTQVAMKPEYVVGMGDQEPQRARLVDVAVRAALATGAGIRVVPVTEDRPVGGLAAILRWST